MAEFEWEDWNIEDLEKDKEKQIRIFLEMLHRLEDAGKCRSIFHDLGVILLQDDILSRD